ncbi:GNAT family N-acetyltransferase [Salinicoccus sp. ID82-1]|uniref:GNAT family N-acetyltransferase n=1 Tax=Salinicoccus cyprini TaxID=2493691 RepID=A0A558ASM5_9STAP|nr:MULTISPECIES: GNAT family N-acetyltransferase [Salinicoccus]MCG1009877.1 GNAT family N-acetyltransferase [Salinicoccus sp. ID82-1]TVT27261.1 GNAT family N-acetyltransferase [Salinicoccus cyprini]
MGDIHIRPFKKEDRESLLAFKLSEQQQIYSSLPIDVLDDAIEDPDRTPCVVLNDSDEIVGFFVLHKHYQHEGYATPHEVVYIRSLSINEELQGRGYGTKVAMSLPLFVQEHFANFDHLYLVVDAENQGAWNLYERAGFMHSATKEDGPIGKERLYYLDLDQKYVHNIKLEQDDSIELPDMKVDIVLNKEKSAGYIEGRVEGDTLHIIHLFINEAERNRGVASSALRQFGTFLRRKSPEVKHLVVSTDDADRARLFERVGFVMIDEAQRKYMKYINY